MHRPDFDGKKVGLGEKKVWIDEVMEPDASLYDPPQNGHYTLFLPMFPGAI